MTQAAASPKRTAPVAASDDVSSGDVLVALSAMPDGDGAVPPQTIKIAPRGKTQTRDGRAYEFDPEALVARFEADGTDIAVDFAHELSSVFGDASKGAVGWISQLEARADGLYGQVEWLTPAVEALRARSHRYLSPTFNHDSFGKATWLHSVSLVAAPALSNMPALASAQLEPGVPIMTAKFAKLAAALGLTEDASEDAMLAALKAKQEGRIEKAVHDEALAKLKAATDELATVRETDRKAKLDALIEGALKAKKITPAEREHYEKLAASDDGFAQVSALFEAMPAKLAASAIAAKMPPEHQASLTAEDRDVMTSMGLTEDDYRKANGLTAG